MAGTGPWLKMLFCVPHSVKLTPQQKVGIYAAQRALNVAMFGQEQDPVGCSKAKAMAKRIGSPLYAPHRPRMNAPASRAAITTLRRDRYKPSRQRRRPQIDHYEPQRQLTLTPSPLKIARTPGAMRAVHDMVMTANDSLKRSSGPRLALGTEDARDMEAFMKKNLARVRYPDYY
jgi:hypothetical protein